MRRDSFGNSPASITLDKLLENCPYAKSVSRIINQYSAECLAILEMPDKKVAGTLIAERRLDWLHKLDDKQWSDEVKNYTRNVMCTVFKKNFLLMRERHE